MFCKTNCFDSILGSVMHSELKAVSKTDHSSYDCLVVCILTHGGHGNILHGTDKKPKKPLTVEKATEYFNGTNCPSLIGKPKVGGLKVLSYSLLSFLYCRCSLFRHVGETNVILG